MASISRSTAGSTSAPSAPTFWRCSPYKIFGPHLGILFGRRELLTSLRRYKVRPASDELPHAFETGTQNHEGLAGWIAAVDYLAELGGDGCRPPLPRSPPRSSDAVVPWEAALSRRFLEGAREIPDSRLYGISDPDRASTSARQRSRSGSATGTRRRRRRRWPSEAIYVWDGHYYALELMERLGLQETGGAVRIGFCHYNTPAEVDRVLEELATLA